MLFYKLLGGGLIILCGYICGRSICQREERKLRQIDGLIDFVSCIRDKIDRYLMPIDRILKECDRDVLYVCGFSGEAENLCEMVDGAVFFDESIRGEMQSFAEELGRGWRESQLKLCDRSLGALRRERDRLSADLPRSQRAAMTLAMSVSAGITILLL